MAEQLDSLAIDARFNGPPESANGGYTCGTLAQYVGGEAEVTLRIPPPLEKKLSVIKTEQGVELREGETIIAEAKPASLQIEVPAPVTPEEAKEAVAHYTGFHSHNFPRCFTCGPARSATGADAGLRIFTGAVAGRDLVAAPWQSVVHDSDDCGNVVAPVVWAALDCPGYFSFGTNVKALLGRMTAKIVKPVPIAEIMVAAGWKIKEDGRKLHCGTALWNRKGELHGFAQQTWIRI